MEGYRRAVTAVTPGQLISPAGGAVDTLRKIPRIADDYNPIRPGPRVPAMNDFILVLGLAGLAFVVYIALRAAVGLLGLLLRGGLLLLILAVVAIAFVM